MCGLVGAAGQLNHQDNDIMKMMLLIDSKRGTDSTGLAFVNERTKEIKVAKAIGHPFNLFETKSFEGCINGSMAHVLMGHNRAKTIGPAITSNAHPFRFDHIVGAHNGTLRLQQCKFDLDEEHNVDSQMIFDSIRKNGVKDTLKEMVGAWALVWYNQEEHSLNFLRNKDRPLFWCKTKDDKKIYWASEWEILDASFTLTNKLDTLFVNDKGFRFFPFEVDTLYSLQLPPNLVDVLPKFKVQGGHIGKSETFFQGYSGGTYNWPKGNQTHKETTKETATKTTLTTNSPLGSTGDNVVILYKDPLDEEDATNDPYGGLVNNKTFDKIAKYGCSSCQADVSWGDNVEIWVENEVILCEECREKNDFGRKPQYPRINSQEVKQFLDKKVNAK